MYVRRFFNEEAKEVMLEMFRYLKESFSKDILGGLDWMDEKTKGMITITV
jgi:predicted metalloendopeptidase